MLLTAIFLASCVDTGDIATSDRFVDEEPAIEAAVRWMETHFPWHGQFEPLSVEPVAIQGQTAGYSIAFEEGGFAIVSAFLDAKPIVAFSDSDSLKGDNMAASKFIAKLSEALAEGTDDPSYAEQNEGLWDALLETSGGPTLFSRNAPMVEPLIEMKGRQNGSYVAETPEDTEQRDPELCFGAAGSKCDGIFGKAAPVIDEENGIVTVTASVGSIMHDTCCWYYPTEGQHCDGLDINEEVLPGREVSGGVKCVYEWRKAGYNFRDGRHWKVSFKIDTPSDMTFTDELMRKADAAGFFGKKSAFPELFYEMETIRKLYAPAGTPLDCFGCKVTTNPEPGIGDSEFCQFEKFCEVKQGGLGRSNYGICADENGECPRDENGDYVDHMTLEPLVIDQKKVAVE